jgi:ligand-binding sensor protein
LINGSSKLKLTDVAPLEKWIVLEKEIVAKTGLDASVFDLDGIRITEFKNWANRLCPVIKASDRGQSFICAVAHMNIASLAKQSKTTMIEECDAGLMKLVVPIFVNNLFLGAVGACGLCLDQGEVDGFMIHKTIGLDETEIERLSDDIGTISSKRAAELGQFIEERVAKIIADYNNI